MRRNRGRDNRSVNRVKRQTGLSRRPNCFPVSFLFTDSRNLWTFRNRLEKLETSAGYVWI